MKLKRKKEIDLSSMSLEELRWLLAKAERLLAIRCFEEGLGKAVSEYQSRDPRVIRF
jgi:hypothetical protein